MTTKHSEDFACSLLKVHDTGGSCCFMCMFGNLSDNYIRTIRRTYLSIIWYLLEDWIYKRTQYPCITCYTMEILLHSSSGCKTSPHVITFMFSQAMRKSFVGILLGTLWGDSRVDVTIIWVTSLVKTVSPFYCAAVTTFPTRTCVTCKPLGWSVYEDTWKQLKLFVCQWLWAALIGEYIWCEFCAMNKRLS